MSEMSKKEAIECIKAIHVQMYNRGNSKWTKACDMAIEALKEQLPLNNVAIEAIKEIREMCWGYDIPSPCCPEYREHHEQMQKIIGLCGSWLKKLEEGDNK